MPKCCVIVTGGEYHPIPAPAPGAFVIACDRGYEYCVRSGIRPDLLIADFDSFSGSVPEGIPVRRLPCEKDDTDTMSAVRLACAEGFEELRIFCALGGRLDHLLANLQALCFAAGHGAFACIESPDTRIFALRDAVLHLPRREGFSLSVFAMTDVCRVRLEGVKYTLADAEITNDFPVGVSNEWAADEALVTVLKGTLLIVESRL